MDPLEILAEFYDTRSKTFQILVAHGKQVANKALAAARRVPGLQPDLEFIDTAAMLHDIGIFLTHSPSFGCYGKHPYVCHGILGSELLKEKGHPELALVCERHVGVGIRIEDIQRHNLPLRTRSSPALRVLGPDVRIKVSLLRLKGYGGQAGVSVQVSGKIRTGCWRPRIAWIGPPCLPGREACHDMSFFDMSCPPEAMNCRFPT
jgi:putative nucleotidyltransferase with HDIG domain